MQSFVVKYAFGSVVIICNEQQQPLRDQKINNRSCLNIIEYAMSISPINKSAIRNALKR